MEMTVTEALAEVKLIQKKIDKKKQLLQGHIIRVGHLPDPFEKDGGSRAVFSKEYQSIVDLYQRLVSIRSAISQVNLSHSITLGETTRTISDWLTWKREVAKPHMELVKGLHMQFKREMDQLASQPKVYKDAEGKPQIVNVIPNMDYAEFMAREDKLTQMYEDLDGKLSLKNATLTIKI